MKLGSLFDGIGGWPWAGVKHGVEPIWSSEIEPFPIKVTKIRFPDMKHLGDITQINGAEIEPVDIITSGSPCQDLSVAGKRAGLEGKRSGLFMDGCRIIKEMRDATNGTYPRFAVWENVPGAFSSTNGEDFRAVLEEYCRITDPTVSLPRPPDNAWTMAGTIMGAGYSVAWRTLDAQYWGVPQRRARIFLVADFGSRRAGEILFKPEGLRGYFAEGESERERIAGNVEGGAGATVFSETGPGWISEGFGCLRAEGENRPSRPCHTVVTAAFKWGNSADARSIGYEEELSPSLAGSSGGSQVPAVILPIGFIGNNDGGDHASDMTPTLRADPDSGNGCKMSVAIYDMTHADEVIRTVEGDKVNTLNGRMGTGGNQVQVVMLPDVSAAVTAKLAKGTGGPAGDECQNLTVVAYGSESDPEKANSLLAKANLSFRRDTDNFAVKGYNVRRLTPTECERLQGLPDGWTNIPGATDTARYKALGNGMAQPCPDYVIERIKAIMAYT